MRRGVTEAAMKKQAAMIALAVSTVLAGLQAGAPLLSSNTTGERLARLEERLAAMESRINGAIDRLEKMPCGGSKR